MHTKAECLSKVAEMERQAALCRLPGPREALLATAEHWRRLALLAEWRDRNPDLTPTRG
jgi:hypothetical protein